MGLVSTGDRLKYVLSYDGVELEHYGAVQTDNDVRGPSDRFSQPFPQVFTPANSWTLFWVSLYLARRRGVLRILNEKFSPSKEGPTYLPVSPFRPSFFPSPSPIVIFPPSSMT